MTRLLIVIALCLLSAQVWGQSNAVAIAAEAKGKYDQQQWAEALALFEKAEARAHSPVLVLYAARCHRNLGRLMKARALLATVVEEDLGAAPPPPFVTAQRDARSDLAALDSRIPRLIIDRSRAPRGWRITLDGTEVATETVQVDPGEHVVVALDGGEERFRKVVRADDGGSVTVSVLEQKQGAAPLPRPVAAPATLTPDEGGDAIDLVPGLVVLGLGLAAVGVGVGLRVSALGKVSDVKDRCVDNSCLMSDAAVIEDAETLQNVSTVLFVVGGTAAATGIVLLVVF